MNEKSPQPRPTACGFARIAKLQNLLRAIGRIPAWGLIAAVLVYKIALSPLLGQHCRFQPTCSAYFIGAVRKYGAVRGSWRGVCRICRCHPWNPGGCDPP